MSAPMEAPRDNLFRGYYGVPLELRADDSTAGSTLFGHFTKFEVWNEIDSWFEGRFMERTVVGSFKKTIAENRDRVKVQFDHGYDTFVGSSPLGPIDVLREEAEGPYYEVPLLDTDYNRDRLLPMLSGRLMDGTLAGSVLGASYRFRVTKEEWVEPKSTTAYNPEKLPERTIREVTLYEFGPVVFPAYASTSVGVRSLLADLDASQRQQLLDELGGEAGTRATSRQTPEAASGTSGSGGSDPRAVLAIAAAIRAKRSNPKEKP